MNNTRGTPQDATGFDMGAVRSELVRSWLPTPPKWAKAITVRAADDRAVNAPLRRSTPPVPVYLDKPCVDCGATMERVISTRLRCDPCRALATKRDKARYEKTRGKRLRAKS